MLIHASTPDARLEELLPANLSFALASDRPLTPNLTRLLVAVGLLKEPTDAMSETLANQSDPPVLHPPISPFIRAAIAVAALAGFG